MSTTITQREFRNQSGDIMRRLDEGESFIVTRNGTPVGELRPLRRSHSVNRDAVLASMPRGLRFDAKQWREDVDALVDPWVSLDDE